MAPSGPLPSAGNGQLVCKRIEEDNVEPEWVWLNKPGHCGFDESMAKKLGLILGDQLNERHSWFQKPDPDRVFVLMEVRSETDYVRHHFQKVLAFFMAMRRFAARLKEMGFEVHYFSIQDPENQQDFGKNLRQLGRKLDCLTWEYQEPDEFRLDEILKREASNPEFPGVMVLSEHFFTERGDVGTFFKGKKSWRMELFYRKMREKTGYLMVGSEPEGLQWNYDAENRLRLPEHEPVPMPEMEKTQAAELAAQLKSAGIETFGELADEVWLPTTRQESLTWLRTFCERLLPRFGKYEDAMDYRHPVLFHSRLSFSLNVKLISPAEVIEAAIQQFRLQPDQISLASIEGFVRQILGWREYMRGLYWARMPGFATENFFDHRQSLPEWFWTGKTRMKCLQVSIGDSLRYAWAHHIQRLMVIGNFSLLAGLNPDEVDAWYLGVYADALEWVEITNTRGMSQFADGGVIASKPYVSSGQYINGMSNYCQACHYQVKEKTGAKSCPFNSLYWDFFNRHQDKLERNPRIGMAYVTWKKMSPDQKRALLERADWIKNNLNSL